MKFNSDKNNLPQPGHSNPMKQHKLETKRLKGSSPEKDLRVLAGKAELSHQCVPVAMKANSILLLAQL